MGSDSSEETNPLKLVSGGFPKREETYSIKREGGREDEKFN